MGPYDEIPSRGKVTSVALLASVLALALVALAVVAYRVVSVEQRAIKVALDDAVLLSSEAQLPLLTNDVASLQSILADLKVHRQVVAACIYNRDGSAVAKFVRDGSDDFQFPIAEVDAQRFENRNFLLFRPIEAKGEVIGNVFLCTEIHSGFVGVPNRNAIFGAIASMLFVSTIGCALWLKRLAARSVPLPELIPLVPRDSEPMIPLEEPPSDKIQELSKRVEGISTRLQKVEKQLAKQGSEPKVRKQKPVTEQPVAAKESLICSSLDLNAVTKKVVETMRAEIQARDAEVTVQSNLPLVLANSSVIEQVLRNLIFNALQFCPEGSKPRIRVGGCVNGNSVRLWVHDNGVGIAPEKQPTIFAGTDRTSASLALVKQGVEQMRGQVGFDSAAGQGSTFWIELPKSQAATLN